MRFVDFANMVSSAPPALIEVGGNHRVLTWRDAAWVTSPVCEVAASLADTTELYPIGGEFVGFLGFAEPFVSSTGLAIDYVLVGVWDDSTTRAIISVHPSRERLQEWADAHNRTAAYDRTQRYQVGLYRGRAIPHNFQEFVVPGEAKPGLTCADIQPLARYVMACLQLLDSETVTEVVSEKKVRATSKAVSTGSRPSPVVIRTHGLVKRVQQAVGGSGKPATKRWWVRGHFRNQAYGPKRAFRRRIFIAPHTAGSATAPEPEPDTRPVVTVLRKEA